MRVKYLDSSPLSLVYSDQRMRIFSANPIAVTSFAGAISIPVIRISDHNVRAGIGA